eukprot:998964-Prymnesium_polylepis.1
MPGKQTIIALADSIGMIAWSSLNDSSVADFVCLACSTTAVSRSSPVEKVKSSAPSSLANCSR